MANEPGEVYGEPKYPVRMNYVTTEEQRTAIAAVAKADGVTLGEAQRRLIEEALDVREQEQRADEEGQEHCEARRVATPVEIARVGAQLAKIRPGGEMVMSRAQLIAQERGEGGTTA